MGRAFHLEIATAVGRQYAPFLRTQLRRLRAMIKSAPSEISLALVGDRQMSALHQRFMHIAGPTDVLSFPLETDPRGRVLSGEIVICVPQARRRVREFSRKERTLTPALSHIERERLARTHHERERALCHELLLYALHGLLHLSGFDDRTDADFNKMHRMEDRLLAKLGIGPVFAPPSRARKSPRRKSGG